MNGRRTYLAGLVTGVALAAMGFAVAAGIRPAEAQRTQNSRWEYLFTDRRVNAEQLNKLGEEGWEAYAINPDFQVAMKRLKYRGLEFPR